MKILVTAASKHGATFEIARRIGETLAEAGHQADVRVPEEIDDVSPYDGVVIGSAVYAGSWLPPVRDLIERQAALLATRPVWLFSSGPLGDPPKPDGDPREVAFAIEATHAIEHRIFPGRSDRQAMGLAEKLVFRVVKAPDGDFRPWADIDSWASQIAQTLSVERSRMAQASISPCSPCP